MLAMQNALSAPGTCCAPGTWSSPGVLLTQKRITTLKQRVADKVEPTYAAFQHLQETADAQLNRQPKVPQEWYVPGYYNDAQGHRDAKQGLADDANSAYALALMFRITDDEKYAVAATRIIDAWAMGVRVMRTEDDSRLSFSYHFPALIFAADLVKDGDDWPEEKQQAFRDFVRTKALSLNTMAHSNNWGNWGLVLVLATAAYLQDRVLFEEGVARWKEFIESQIADDGHLPHEVGRNKGVGDYGLWYSHFSLMPQTIAAEIARVNGVDLYDYVAPSGRSLRNAFQHLAPWARKPDTFPYYQGDADKLPFRPDYISYWEILNARWPNTDATAMLKITRPLTAEHSAPHLTFTHGGLLNDD